MPEALILSKSPHRARWWHWPVTVVRAKKLLKSKGVDFKEINLEGKQDEMAQLIQKTGMRTVPQIFIDDELVGGFTELNALEKSGELDKKLKS